MKSLSVGFILRLQEDLSNIAVDIQQNLIKCLEKKNLSSWLASIYHLTSAWFQVAAVLDYQNFS